jgi:hypothetical protein
MGPGMPIPDFAKLSSHGFEHTHIYIFYHSQIYMSLRRSFEGVKNLDQWQQEVLEATGNLCIRAGRQTGKSFIIAVKAGQYAATHKKKSVMVISATERQAYLLFSRILAYLHDNHRSLIKGGKDRPTKTEIKLLNGSVLRCLPTGMDGLGIRGYTVDLLIADEAAFIPPAVWQAVTPMLTTTGGHLILLSTPFGKNDFFYNSYFHDDSFKTWHVSSEEVALGRDEPQRSNMLKDQERARRMMSKRAYTQEYLAEFVDGLMQFFPDDLIRKCMIAARPKQIEKHRSYYLGVDVGRMGDDESAFAILELQEDRKLVQIENQVTRKTLLSDTTKHITTLHKIYDFQKVFIDSGGIGVGVYDHLLENDDTKRVIVSINNAKRVLNNQGDQRVRLLKEDLYTNLLRLMETAQIDLLEDSEIFQSLKSVQYEHTTDSLGRVHMKIFGNYTHITEALIRAAWCVKYKPLNIWIASI